MVDTMKTVNGKEIKVKNYFEEAYKMYDWLKEHPEYKMVEYKFSFQYGYTLYYAEK